MSVVEINPWQLLLKGGPMIWPILVCWIASLTIVLERFHMFSSLERRSASLGDKVLDAVKKNDLKLAVGLCDEEALPLAQVLRAGLLSAPRGREEMSRAMDEAARSEIPLMEKGLAALGMMTTIAPFLGVLGTVVGMAGVLRTFQVRSEAMNAITPADMAAGVWAALIATAAGVLVAIFAFFSHHYLLSRVRGLVCDMERYAAGLTDILAETSAGDQGDGA